MLNVAKGLALVLSGDAAKGDVARIAELAKKDGSGFQVAGFVAMNDGGASRIKATGNLPILCGVPPLSSASWLT